MRPPHRAVLLAFALALVAAPALAQAHNPFGVGISEGGGTADGVTGWLLAEQAGLERQLSAAVRAVAADGSALDWLLALSFGYGVFHAAGPGHGKAVISSYLFASERALRRGLLLSSLAALLQGTVAIALVGVLTLVLHGTAQRMREVAALTETSSFAAVAVLGAWLTWRKGRLLVRAARDAHRANLGLAFAPAMVFATGGGPAPGTRRDRWVAQGAADPETSCDCGTPHAPDPRILGDRYSMRSAAAAVFAAGSRPCSGAILVLVFAATQGLFGAGVLSVAAMSVGTALTTGALAALAVLARGAALALTRPGTGRGLVALRVIEVLAGLVVLVAGLSLFMGAARLGVG